MSKINADIKSSSRSTVIDPIDYLELSSGDHSMISAQGSKAQYHGFRHGISKYSSGGVENSVERYHERDLFKIMADGGAFGSTKKDDHLTNVDEVGNNLRDVKNNEIREKYKADQVKVNAYDKLVNDYIKSNELTRQEKNNFLRLFEMGVYYIHNGKINFDSRKFQELQHLNNSNTKFDKKVERKAYKKYNKYARKRFGYTTFHGSPQEEWVNKNNPTAYSQIEYEKDRFIKNYKAKYEKKRQRYIKKQFKKIYRFNKWKNKKGYSL